MKRPKAEEVISAWREIKEKKKKAQESVLDNWQQIKDAKEESRRRVLEAWNKICEFRRNPFSNDPDWEKVSQCVKEMNYAEAARIQLDIHARWGKIYCFEPRVGKRLKREIKLKREAEKRRKELWKAIRRVQRENKA